MPAGYSTTVSLIAMILPITDDLVLRVKTRGVTAEFFWHWQMPLSEPAVPFSTYLALAAKRDPAPPLELQELDGSGRKGKRECGFTP